MIGSVIFCVRNRQGVKRRWIVPIDYAICNMHPSRQEHWICKCLVSEILKESRKDGLFLRLIDYAVCTLLDKTLDLQTLGALLPDICRPSPIHPVLTYTFGTYNDINSLSKLTQTTGTMAFVSVHNLNTTPLETD
jgi:hypothetical protein